MSVALITGSAGLIGSEAVRHFSSLGLDIVGIDNDMRGQFFGPEASTSWNVLKLTNELGSAYSHHDVDIRDRDALARVFKRYGSAIALVIHTAAQPSHDWAVREPYTDFDVNAVGTLNVLQNVREHCIEAPVIHCSTTRCTATAPTPCHSLSSRAAGRSSRVTHTSRAFARTCPSTGACTRSSGRPRSPRTSWSRSTGGTST